MLAVECQRATEGGVGGAHGALHARVVRRLRLVETSAQRRGGTKMRQLVTQTLQAFGTECRHPSEVEGDTSRRRRAGNTRQGRGSIKAEYAVCPAAERERVA